ncbi:ribose 5-phosphate isomerase B [Dysgonomonas sp. 25]|uniref:ribose 5-phosphate isomerase B n=1 Tax=Dysgonomonas sp. 25 TaxID=2302933 RepID=UPI0013D77730|nr:ribose 5-phosphate isomerase B [Dysgonomonas sp. 25]NDV67567.1 ribose 5-phosphate isomerase B [Dysgonomonas sp. 25]
MAIFPANLATPIGLCSDHAGFEMKQYVIGLLEQEGVSYKDYGAYSEESSDYPDFAHQMGYAIENGECAVGIAFCGTGNGISIAINKHQGVRSALCWNSDIAFYAKSHNNANVISLPARVVANEEAKHILKRFFETTFEGGRHERRIEKIPLK